MLNIEAAEAFLKELTELSKKYNIIIDTPYYDNPCLYFVTAERIEGQHYCVILDNWTSEDSLDSLHLSNDKPYIIDERTEDKL